MNLLPINYVMLTFITTFRMTNLMRIFLLKKQKIMSPFIFARENIPSEETKDDATLYLCSSFSLYLLCEVITSTIKYFNYLENVGKRHMISTPTRKTTKWRIKCSFQLGRQTVKPCFVTCLPDNIHFTIVFHESQFYCNILS